MIKGSLVKQRQLCTFLGVVVQYRALSQMNKQRSFHQPPPHPPHTHTHHTLTHTQTDTHRQIRSHQVTEGRYFMRQVGTHVSI